MAEKGWRGRVGNGLTYKGVSRPFCVLSKAFHGGGNNADAVINIFFF